MGSKKAKRKRCKDCVNFGHTDWLGQGYCSAKTMRVVNPGRYACKPESHGGDFHPKEGDGGE